jgi:hypothetical protein
MYDQNEQFMPLESANLDSHSFVTDCAGNNVERPSQRCRPCPPHCLRNGDAIGDTSKSLSAVEWGVRNGDATGDTSKEKWEQILSLPYEVTDPTRSPR